MERQLTHHPSTSQRAGNAATHSSGVWPGRIEVDSVGRLAAHPPVIE